MDEQQITTYQLGFYFSDANHNITKKEYVRIMHEIEEKMNLLHSTNTITIHADNSCESGFEIKDSRWPSEYYKTIRHNFKGIGPEIHFMNYKNFNCIIEKFNKEEWENNDTIIPQFRSEVSFEELHGFPLSKVVSRKEFKLLNQTEESTGFIIMPDSTKNKLIKKLKKTNEKINKSTRHYTWLKSFHGAPKWSQNELDVIINIFNNHGIITKQLKKDKLKK